MIQEYRKEMAKVHAGEDLIRRTKLAALQESGSYALRKKRQQRLFPIFGAAAACILLLLLPGALQQAGSRNQTPQRMGHKTEQTREISQIPQKDKLVSMDKMPERFEAAEVIKEEEVTYYLLWEEESKAGEVYIKEQEQGYLFTAQAEDDKELLALSQEAYRRETKEQ